MRADQVIIFSDLDGTMLTDWTMGPYVPEANIKAIKKFISAGGMFSVASGRQYGDTLELMKEISFDAPLVQGNGAVLYDSRANKLLKKTAIPEKVRLECLDYFKRKNNMWMVAADEYDIYQLASGNNEKDTLLSNLKPKIITEKEYLELEPIKICLVLANASDMPSVRNDLAGFESAKLFCMTQSNEVIVELMEKNVGKASGVAEAVKFAGAEDRMLICIGDFDNDCGMLELADIAACPTNSAPKVLELADIVTCSNNEGAIADLIQRLGL